MPIFASHMNCWRRPYHWIAMGAVALSMLMFFKINKHSFYHHYFKVIEEVEIRNSQQLIHELVPPMAKLQEATEYTSLFSTLLLMALLPSVVFAIQLLLQPILRWVPVQSSPRAFYTWNYPTRAP